MLMANVQMGSFNSGINGVFLSSSPPNPSSAVHNFSVSRKPIFGIALSSIGVRKGWDFNGRKPKISTICALGNGEKEAHFPNTPSNPLSSVHNFSVSPKPIFQIALNSIGMKKSWDFDGRKPKFSATSELANGEIEACSDSVQLLEKDFKFSPTFSDYVTVMESVRTDRSKNSSVAVDGVNPKKRLVGKSTSHKDGEKTNTSRGKLGYRVREKDSKNRKHGDVESSRSGWGLVEKILEKRTLGRSGNDLQNGSSSLYKEFNATREIVDDKHFVKERVGHSWNHSKKWKDRQQNEREVRRMDELRIRSRSKDALGNGSRDRSSEIKRVGSNSKEYKKVDHANDGRAGMGENEINQSKDEHFYKSKVERKMGEFEYNKSSPERRSLNGSRTVRQWDESLVTERSYGSGMFNGINMSKKSDGSEISKNIRKDEIFLRMDQRKTDSSLIRNETKILEKEIHGQSRSERHVRFHDDTKKTEKIGSRAIGMQRSGNGNIQSDKVPGGEIDSIDFEDRAAFRTFEVFTDVRNRPRVLRMELEERIQKLAKWLNATDVNMPEWQFSKMMHSAKIKFTEHSILRVVQILGTLGNWKRALQVVEWLQSRERFKCYKSRYIYTTVLDVLGKAKRPIEALNIFYAMRQELSSYPDLAAYHCIAVTLGQAGLMKELFDVIDCMRAAPEKKFKLGPLQKWDPRLEPDLVVYNAVLNACVQQKQWKGAFWVLQQLKQQNLQPTNTTYGLIMEVMLACGKYNLVHEVFRKVEKTSIPSTLNYKVLVNTLWREEKIDEAVLAVKDMERRGVVGSASLYYDLARCLCSAGRCQEALLQINKICKVAKKPLVVTYTGLIQACLDSGSIENGTYIFNQMHKFCSPNIVTCNIMLKSYIEHGMFEEAKDLFQKVLDGSHQIKSKADADQKAIPDKFTFNTMMNACVATNNWDDFENTYQQMLHHGYHFDTRRHLRMVLDAFRAGKRQVIETTWNHLIRFGRAPPPPIIQERFCIKLQEGEHLAAISCIEAHQGNEMHAFTEKSWLNLLKSNAHRIKNDTIFRLDRELSNLIAERDRPHPMYKNLLNACREFCCNL